MKKFIVIYYAPADAMAQMSTQTPEESQKGMEAWHAWATQCGSGLVDLGTPLGMGKKVTQSGASESEKGVAGYSILQAEDMAGALKMLENHPHLVWNAACSIEVYESLPLPA
ncbi:MAG: hypothetical protein HY462_00050 [Parcubacteria group bacterium]|nr:hypothetical protein [Parcubacteria group bacterium]